MENLRALISEYIKRAQQEKAYVEEIFSDKSSPVGKNEFMFFIKPEITIDSNAVQLDRILDFILRTIRDFGLTVHNVRLLSARYLEEYNIIAQHYGVINKIASNALENMSGSAKDMFEKIYGKPVLEVNVAGGFEFLEKYPIFNAYSLHCLWQNLVNTKLAGGTYSEKINLGNEIVYLINGFHPMQLKNFIEKGRSIVAFTLSGDMSWKEARTDFAGTTNPVNAEPGSIRRTLFDRKSEFGLQEVSQGVNGVHLSAGPVEALVELRRFDSNFALRNGVKSFSDFSFGKSLLNAFNGNIDNIIDNHNVVKSGNLISIFDLTEEKDSDEAIYLLKKYL